MKGLGNEVYTVELSGKKLITGTVIEASDEIVVLFTGRDYMYISVSHIQSYKINDSKDNDISDPQMPPSIFPEEAVNELSLKYVIEQAKHIFVEINVTGSQTLHGIITHSMDDYVVFQSPVLGNVFITIPHIKWLIPIPENEQLYGLDNHEMALQKSGETFEKCFSDQLVRLTNKIIVLDMGKNQQQIGRLDKVDDQIIEIKNARNRTTFFNIRHIKMVQGK